MSRFGFFSTARQICSLRLVNYLFINYLINYLLLSINYLFQNLGQVVKPKMTI